MVLGFRGSGVWGSEVLRFRSLVVQGFRVEGASALREQSPRVGPQDLLSKGLRMFVLTPI